MHTYEPPAHDDPRDANYLAWAESRYDSGEPCEWPAYASALEIELSPLAVVALADGQDCPF